jgi:hypothetical protein
MLSDISEGVRTLKSGYQKRRRNNKKKREEWKNGKNVKVTFTFWL